ncbi:MAG: hypothetical protein WAO35_07400 [Terriglobia bacterium]
MTEKIGTIRNPLTIIAIFAGIAEVSGTAVLPFLSGGNQGKYTWFLIVFPLLLIVIFFLTLNFNHRVLYAPSDFRNEDNFFKSFRSASPSERAEKLRKEVREIESDSDTEQQGQKPATPPLDQASKAQILRRSAQGRYLLAEELVLNKISQELGRQIQRDVRLSDSGAIFDGIVVDDAKVTAIEVKYIQGAETLGRRSREIAQAISQRLYRVPESLRRRFSLILAVATDAPRSDQLADRLSALVKEAPVPVQVKVFNLEELEREFNLAG